MASDGDKRDGGGSARRQEGAAIEEQMLRGGVMLRNFPSAAANDMHGAILQLGCSALRGDPFTRKSQVRQPATERDASVRFPILPPTVDGDSP